MAMRGKASTSKKFECIAWSKYTSQNTYGAGIIAGGMSDGSISVWDPAAIISATDNNTAATQLASITGKHKDSVTTLAFNPTSGMNHILASGSADKTILLFDLKQPGSDTVAHYAPAEGEVTGHAAAVSKSLESGGRAYPGNLCKRWNHLCVDLRAKRPWCHLKDQAESLFRSCVEPCWFRAGDAHDGIR